MGKTPLVEIRGNFNSKETPRGKFGMINKDRETEEVLLRLVEILDYNQDSGKITFKDSRSGAVAIGQEAGWIGSDGYRRLTHRDRLYMAHRVAWAIHYKSWPVYTIDHINRDRSDNRIVNLRDVPQSENNKNKSPYNKAPRGKFGEVAKQPRKTP